MAIVLSPDPRNWQKPDHERIEQTTLLLVEGRDDQALMARIARQLEAEGHQVNIQIRDMGGRDKWTTDLAQIRKNEFFQQNVTAIGLVQDADSDASAARQRCEQIFRQNQLPFPRRPQVIDAAGPLKTGIFIIPSLARVGAVEQLCLDSVQDTARASRSADFIDGLPEAGFPPVEDRDKAVVQAYLSAKPKLKKALWMALRDGCFDMTHDAFNEVRDFLRALTAP